MIATAKTPRKKRSAKAAVPAPVTVKIAILGGALLFDAVLTPEPDGRYSCEVPAMPGCFSCGDTFDEARAMITDAAQLHFTSLLEQIIEEGSAAMMKASRQTVAQTIALA